MPFCSTTNRLPHVAAAPIPAAIVAETTWALVTPPGLWIRLLAAPLTFHYTTTYMNNDRTYGRTTDRKVAFLGQDTLFIFFAA